MNFLYRRGPNDLEFFKNFIEFLKWISHSSLSGRGTGRETAYTFPPWSLKMIDDFKLTMLSTCTVAHMTGVFAVVQFQFYSCSWCDHHTSDRRWKVFSTKWRAHLQFMFLLTGILLIRAFHATYHAHRFRFRYYCLFIVIELWILCLKCLRIRKTRGIAKDLKHRKFSPVGSSIMATPKLVFMKALKSLASLKESLRPAFHCWNLYQCSLVNNFEQEVPECMFLEFPQVLNILH